MRKQDRKLDLAARAAWLYYIAGKRQDEIAAQLNVSRQAVQRLVSLAVSEKLIKFRLDHPIATCMALSEELRPATASPTARSSRPIEQRAGQRRHRDRRGRAPGDLSGRARSAGASRSRPAGCCGAMADEMPVHGLPAAQARLAGRHDLTRRACQLLRGRSSACRADRRAVLSDPDAGGRQQRRGASVFCRPSARSRWSGIWPAQAVAAFVGIGNIGWQSPMHRDHFVTDQEITELIESGAVGEIAGWAYR